MPILKFQLRNRRLILDASPSKEEWELVFNAISQPAKDRQTFNIFIQGKKFDAYSVAGAVYIRPRATQSGQASPNPDLSIGSVAVAHSPEDRGNTPPYFVVELLLSAESFRRLQDAEMRGSVVELWVTTAKNEKALTYGDDPDGGQLEWWLDRSEISGVESISVRFIEPQA